MAPCRRPCTPFARAVASALLLLAASKANAAPSCADGSPGACVAPAAGETLLLQRRAVLDGVHESLVSRTQSPELPPGDAPKSMAAMMVQVRRMVAETVASLARNGTNASAEPHEGPSPATPPEDARQAQILEQLQPILAEILAGMRGDHGEDQDEVARHAGYVHECYEDVVEKNATHIAPRKARSESMQRNVSACESGLVTYHSSLVTHCTATHDYIRDQLSSAIDCPLPADKSAAALEEYMHCANSSFHEKLGSARMHLVECQSATAVHKQAADDCRDTKRQYLRTQCEVNQLVTMTCDTYASCFATETRRYAATRTAVEAAEAGRKREALAHAKIVCFLNVIVENVTVLGGDAGERKLAECDAISAHEDVSDFSIKYPTIEAKAECSLPLLEGDGTAFCATVSLHNASGGEAPHADVRCSLGEELVIVNPWGERLSDVNGSVELSKDTTQTWTLEDAGSGRVYLKGHRGQRLTDNAGRLSVSAEKGAQQQWTIVAAGTDRFYLQSKRGAVLQDYHDHGHVGLTSDQGLWQQWSITGSQGSPACVVRCIPTVAKDMEVTRCTNDLGDPSVECFDGDRGIGWAGHVVTQSGRCRVTYGQSVADGKDTGEGRNCVILANGTHPTPGVRFRANQTYEGPQLLAAFEKKFPGFDGSVKDCLDPAKWDEVTVDFDCEAGNMVIVAESFSTSFKVVSLKECAAE